MHVCVIGAGLMGSAICYDLLHQTLADRVTLVDMNKDALCHAKEICGSDRLQTEQVDISDEKKMKEVCIGSTVMISAVPYFFNETLTRMAIECGSHFIDLGGNNDVVASQQALHDDAIDGGVTVIPDSGLAPGLVSVITRDVVDCYKDVNYVKLRVGGLPVHPQPPLNYEIVFSPNGLINEYVEDAVVLDQGKLVTKQSLTEVELISFPEPFGEMEAFVTSGGCSTLPSTYKDMIPYLDYKTIRYPGHCEKMKTFIDLGFGSTNPVVINDVSIAPRDMMIHQLNKMLPKTGDDVVLLKVLTQAKKNGELLDVEYTMIDYKDPHSTLTAMMRTTGFPVSITADLIGRKHINKSGVFCPEEIVPSQLMFEELRKRKVVIDKKEKVHE